MKCKYVKGYSYLPHLVSHLLKHKPKRIFEYGSGLSTMIMAILLPDSEIVTVENSRFWYHVNKYRYCLRLFKNVEFILETDTNKYVSGILPSLSRKYKKIDFVFIDGIERERCLGLLNISQDGKDVMLHDSERYPNDDNYKIIYDKDNTRLIKL